MAEERPSLGLSDAWVARMNVICVGSGVLAFLLIIGILILALHVSVASEVTGGNATNVTTTARQ